jgi:hypothetical protein
MVRLRHVVVAGIAGDDLVARIGRCTIRPVVVPVLSGDRDAALADRRAPRTANVRQFSVGKVMSPPGLQDKPAAALLPANAPRTTRSSEISGRDTPLLSTMLMTRHGIDRIGYGTREDLDGRMPRAGWRSDPRRSTRVDAAVQMDQRALRRRLPLTRTRPDPAEALKRRRAHRIGAVGDRHLGS